MLIKATKNEKITITCDRETPPVDILNAVGEELKDLGEVELVSIYTGALDVRSGQRRHDVDGPLHIEVKYKVVRRH